ncbi:MAG: isoleucine--tRNA ligase, partial [Chitinophagales bacterium]
MNQKNIDKVNHFPEFEGLDLVSIDEQMLTFWKNEEIFKKSVNQKDSNKPFVFYEGPPSANGMPGIHHVIGRTVKDIFCRYKTMQGFQVKRKGGWDTHGLPVELKVEKELGITKEDIGTKISVEEYNAECRKTVLQFKNVWDDLTNKMGYWVDLDNPYITYENDYIESVWWAISELYKKDLLYKGYTIQPFSPAAGTGLSTHELNQPGAYQDVTDTTAVAQFKIKKDKKSALLFENGNEEAHFLAWTTTPWTLPSNTALAVGKKIDYVQIKTFNPYTFLPVHLVLAKPLLGKWFKEENQDADFAAYVGGAKNIPWSLVKEFKGADLEGVNYEQLLPYHQPEDGAAFRVILGDFVTTEDGTGIVHTAPTFGADDMRVAKVAGIGSLTLVDKQGKFVDGMEEFSGRYVKDYKEEENYRSVDIDISIKLKEENKAFNVQKHVHSYPHCWRTDKPVLYYPLDSWFIKTTSVKEELIANNNKINWKPESTGKGRFGNWLENLQDWNLSRSRFWGIPLPVWRTEDGEEIKCIGSVEELNAEMKKANEVLGLNNEELPDLHKPYIDRVVLVSESGKPMKREEDVIDVWFDSGSMPFAQQHYPFAPSPPKGDGPTNPKYQTARKSTYPLLKELKEKKINEETQEETILWEYLKTKKLGGYKFRRQHIIDMFIVDFVCLKKGLIVEVDGAYHNLPEQIKNDQERTEVLESLGFKVIRFTNNEVIGDIENVLNKIEAELNKSADFKYDKSSTAEESSPSGPGAFPADFIAEGVDQTRGWFFTLHAISTMLFGKPAYKNVIANGLVQDALGQKMSKRLGNAVDPFETLGKYGADATRWYIISNAQPWDNLKFNTDGIEEVKRKFFGTLYNTYSFFSLYANIDNFQYKEAEIAIAERPEIDQWILSCLNTLIEEVQAAMEDYEPTKATRLIDNYVDEFLSNWYVRLCRRRFWKGEYSQDKISAYQTLYTNLDVLSRLMASVAPFFADFLFKSLNKATQKDAAESVHLADFPKANKALINKNLEERMDMAKNITSMVLSIRAKEKLKVRQPLQRILIPIDGPEMQAKMEKVESYILSEVNVKEMQYVSG